MEKLFFSLTLIISGLVAGYSLRLFSEREIIVLPLPIGELRRILQKIGLLFFLPISFMTAVWVVQFSDLRIALLPILGFSALAIGGLFGLAFSRFSGASPRQTGVLFCCCSFTNIGAIGALICYMFLGEAGFALVALYKMFEEIAYYTIGFPIARYYSGAANDEEMPLLARFLGILRDPFVASILTAFFVGITLNLAGIRRPVVFETINSLFIPAGTFVLIVSIGLGMKLSRIGSHIRPALSVSLMKSAGVPAAVTTLAWLAGFNEIDNGLPLKVVLILSSMPVAFNSLVAASIYDLDLDLANSCWLVSTLSLAIVMPWLYWILQYF